MAEPRFDNKFIRHQRSFWFHHSRLPSALPSSDGESFVEDVSRVEVGFDQLAGRGGWTPGRRWRNCQHMEMRKPGGGTGVVQLISKMAKIQDDPFYGKYGSQAHMQRWGGLERLSPLVMLTDGLQKRECWQHFYVLKFRVKIHCAQTHRETFIFRYRSR